MRAWRHSLHLCSVVCAVLSLFVLHGLQEAQAAGKSEIDACLDAYEAAQRFRLRNQLLTTRTRLHVCSRDVCPAQIRQDCTEWLDEVDERLPSIVLVVRSQGRDLREVRVWMDGQPLVERIDRTPIDLDPGTHWLRFEVSELGVVEQQVVAREGEKSQQVVVEFGRETPTAPTIPTAAYVLGGVGVAGLLGFTIFGLRGKSGKEDLETCKGHCPGDDVDAVRRDFIIADVSLGIGLAALGTATVLILRQSSTQEDAPPRKTGKFHINMTPHGVGALFHLPF